ncbi:MAG: GEVED domain-containing protein, partial [Phycisphaerae bacterium]
MPDDLLWAEDFQRGEFQEALYYKVPDGEYWWDPATGQLIPSADHEIWRIDIYIDPALHDIFVQTGTRENPVIYWLDVQVETLGGQQIGWKTRRWTEHFMDDAVWDRGSEGPRDWKEMRYPDGHRYEGDSIDMAFALTFEDVSLDWGDAPDDATGAGYPTLAISNGANHAIGGPWLGDRTDSPDADPDGQPDPNALGDDTFDLNDDEDGVIIPPMIQGQPATITVEVNDGGTGIGGVLEAWIDWNGDNAWDASEIIHNTWLPGAVHSFNVNVPSTAVVGQTFARFRISTRGGLTWQGPAGDGEVEDYEVFIEESAKHDLGDAPDSTNSHGLVMTAYPGTTARFPTVYQAGSPPHGPIHWNPLAVAHLGPGVTLENEADIGPDQDGPNNIDPPTGLSDQDGRDDSVHFPLNLSHGQWTTFDFDVTAIAMPPGNRLYVNVWFDWLRNGQWDDTPVLPDGTAAPEWAVRNQTLALPGPGMWPMTTDPFVVFQPHPNEGDPIWMRITLSEQPHDPAGTDPGTGGSGPVDGYEFGETEDYYIEEYIEDELDFGDAPEIAGATGYPTTLANNGARHILGGPWLGDDTDFPDWEPDGQPDPNALGDDNDGNDDEDGVQIPPLMQGQTANITYEVNGAASGVGAYVDGWIDFNGDNTWDASESVLTAGPLGNGVYTFPVTPLSTSVVGQTFARFRINTRGNIGPTGQAVDGEVEDYEVIIEEMERLDWGDAPDSTAVPGYPTLAIHNGANHVIAGPWLGDDNDAPDAEGDGQPDPNALG